MSKFLVTGGCSFSECISTHIDTWPKHLARDLLDYKHISKAMGSQGNGLISRGIIYEVTRLLEFTNHKDILVGIMWSSPDRFDFYKKDEICFPNVDEWVENPTGFINEETKNWVILNHHWKNNYAKQYYGNFYDQTGSLIYSLEHILRVQWFLKLHNIKYFMTTYTSEVLQNINQPDVKYLYDQIDFDYFLPTVGEYEWCQDYSGLKFPHPGDNHPSSEQHKKFTGQVILPFLQQRKYI